MVCCEPTLSHESSYNHCTFEAATFFAWDDSELHKGCLSSENAIESCALRENVNPKLVNLFIADATFFENATFYEESCGQIRRWLFRASKKTLWLKVQNSKVTILLGRCTAR